MCDLGSAQAGWETGNSTKPVAVNPVYATVMQGFWYHLGGDL